MFVDSRNSRREGIVVDRAAQHEAEIKYHMDMLKSRDPLHREAAVKRLGQLKAGIPLLLSVLGDPHSRVRAAAADALGNADSAGQTDVVDHLLATIDDPNDFVTAAAIRALGRIKAEDARGQITPFLDNASPFIVAAAIEALGQLRATELASCITGFFDSANPHIQAAAVRCLARWQDTSVGPRILTLLMRIRDDGMDKVPAKLVTALIDALARLQEKEAAPILADIALHDVGYRTLAVEALSRLETDEGVPLLAPLLVDPSSPLRESLIKLMLQTKYRAALPIIRTLLKDAKVSVRQAALMVVQEWQDLASVAQVRWMCHNDPSSRIRPQAIRSLVAMIGIEALPDLVALRDDLNGQVRLVVVESLAQLDRVPIQALGVLNHLANDADERVAQVARAVLEQQRAEGGASDPFPHPTPVPVPDDVYPELPGLLISLERWQVGLAAQLGKCDPASVLEIDAALSTLIVAVRNANRNTDVSNTVAVVDDNVAPTI